MSTLVEPVQTESKPVQFIALWSLIVFSMTAAYSCLLPLREDLQACLGSIKFWEETLIWVPAILISGAIAYIKKQENLKNQGIRKSRNSGIGFLPLFAPLLLVVIRVHSLSDVDGHAIVSELDFYKGRCGIITLTTGVFTAVTALTLVSKFSRFRGLEIGGWALVSSGCYASFLMQFVCAQEKPMHLFIWHYLPMMFLALTALRLERYFENRSSSIKKPRAVGLSLPVRFHL